LENSTDNQNTHFTLINSFLKIVTFML